MVKGIETDTKRYKHIQQDDEKILTQDLREIKKTVQHYIETIRPDDIDKKQNTIHTTKKTMTIDHIVAILFLGIFGSITLIFSILMLLQTNHVLGIPILLFGAACVIAFIMYEKYR